MTDKLKLKILFLIYLFFPAGHFFETLIHKVPRQQFMVERTSDRRQLAAVSPTLCSSVQGWMNPGWPIDVHQTSNQRRASHVKRATVYGTKWHEFKPIDHEKILLFFMCMCV